MNIPNIVQAIALVKNEFAVFKSAVEQKTSSSQKEEQSGLIRPSFITKFEKK